MHNLNRIHLNGLRALESVGRLGSLQKAADELGVSPGAVSQQIIKAEAQLGRPVFTRTPLGLRKTGFGERFLDRLSSGFRVLDDAVGSVCRQADGILTMSVAPVFASKWLVPRLAAYSRLHPEVTVRLDASSQLVSPDGSDVDLAIRVGAGNWPDVKAELVLRQEIFPVCAPELASRLKEPRDLLDVPVVRDANSNLSWNLWLAPLGLSEEQLKPGNSFNDASLALDAAVTGQGVMLGWATLAEQALTAGTLVAPFPGRVSAGFGYYLITSRTRREDRKVTDFKQWIKAELAETARQYGGAVD